MNEQELMKILESIEKAELIECFRVYNRGNSAQIRAKGHYYNISIKKLVSNNDYIISSLRGKPSKD